MSKPCRFKEVSGFVLAGGASRRLGLDKAKLLLGSERMVDRQIRLLRTICSSVSIVGPPDNFPDTEVQVYEDEIPGKGPLGGIHTGLRRSRTEFSLFVSCDMPFMEARFLRYLCGQALEGRAPVTIPPPWANGRYPLCAILRRRVRSAIRRSLASGQNKVGRFFSKSQRRTISKAEFARAGFSPRIFYNVNTPEEYENARRQFEGLNDQVKDDN